VPYVNWRKSEKAISLKFRLFKATVESVLLYGCSTDSEETSLNGTYTRMLRAIYNISCRDHITNEQLYGTNPRLTDLLRLRRLKLADHVFVINLLLHVRLLHGPAHGSMSRGRPRKNIVDQLLVDTNGSNIAQLKAYMGNKELWEKLSRLP